MSASVSVIIPTHNRAPLLVETVANVLAQTLPPLEVIIVDDGSTDETAQVLRQFGAAVRYLHQKKSGAAAARNRGLQEARGEFIQFMDSDDLMSRNKLEAQARTLKETRADVCLSPWAKVRIEGKRLQFENHALQQAPPPDRLSPADWLVRGWSTVLQSLLIRRALLERVGPLNEHLVTNDDIDLVWRLLKAGAHMTFTDECLLLYRLHDSDKLSASARWHGQRLQDWKELLTTMRQDVREGRVTLNTWSRVYLAVDWWETQRHLAAAGIAELERNLWTQRTARLFRRGCEILDGLRARLRGSRWMPGYCSGPLRPHQRQLVEALGLICAE